MSKISTDRCHAAGGARDWNGVRRGVSMPWSALNVSAMRSKPTGTGSFGGSATNEVETKKIEAQIAQ